MRFSHDRQKREQQQGMPYHRDGTGHLENLQLLRG